MAPSPHCPAAPAHLCVLLAILGACGPKPGNDTQAGPDPTDPTDSTDPSSTASSDLPTSELPTTGASAASTTSTATGDSTDPILTSTSSGEPGSTSDGSSDDTGPDCVALMQGGTAPPVPSGWERCGDQLPHRVTVEVCQVPAAPSDCPHDFESCKTDIDCAGLPFGSCQEWNNHLGCSCVAGCETDADCEPGHVCRCGGEVLGPWTTCVPSNCQDDAACGDHRCQFALSEGISCGAQVTLGSCSTPADDCDSDLSCDETLPCLPFADSSGWQCVFSTCD